MPIAIETTPRGKFPKLVLGAINIVIRLQERKPIDLTQLIACITFLCIYAHVGVDEEAHGIRLAGGCRFEDEEAIGGQLAIHLHGIRTLTRPGRFDQRRKRGDSLESLRESGF